MEDEESETVLEMETPAIRAARLLGYAGLAPFIALSLWLYGIAPGHAWRAGTILLLLGYGAVILSFLGGVRWGLALVGLEKDSRNEYAFAVIPSLVGWIAVATPVPYAFALLAVAFAAHGAWDTVSVQFGRAPEWYGKLRTVLTVVVVATMILAFIATS